MSVLAVIVTYKSQHVIGRCLKGLAMGGYPCHLAIWDNGSPDRDSLLREVQLGAGCIRNTWIRMHSENLMFTRACNEAVRRAPFSPHEFVLLLNPDCWGESEGWLADMVKATHELSAGVVGPKLVRQDGVIVHAGGRFVPTSGGWHIGYGSRDGPETFQQPSKAEYVTGACFLVRWALWERLGGLPEKYVHYESDKEFCRAAWEAGSSVWYVPVRLVHLEGKSSL